MVHDIDVGDATPVKLPPYRVSPVKQKAMEEEIKYMLHHDLIKRGPSEWSSPVILQPKPDGNVRFCVDFRKVYALSKADAYSLPRVDDSVDKIGATTYITKVDLVKGYLSRRELSRCLASWLTRPYTSARSCPMA